jgi:hypothetical protein
MVQHILDSTILNQALTQLQRGEDVTETLDGLVWELFRIRQHSSPEVWKDFATIICRRHPLMQLLLQDPITWRAFTKPRGYAGDAVMMDLIYAAVDGCDPTVLEETSELGRHIYSYNIVHAPAARAVRARRQIIIDKLNHLSARKPKPHVLTLACGHLREAKRCTAFVEGKIGRYVALDQDRVSVALVERELGPLGVEAVHGSVKDVLRGHIALSGFDLIYVLGLHDYLSTAICQRLSEILFDMLNPGGQLVVTNVLPTLITSGYMEAFMDWWLIYRSQEHLMQLAETVPTQHLETIRLYTEENQVFAFLEIERKA